MRDRKINVRSLTLLYQGIFLITSDQFMNAPIIKRKSRSILKYCNNKKYESTVFIFVTLDNTCITGFLSLRVKILYYQRKSINKYVPTQHPAHQVNISRKEFCVRWILANFLGQPV